MGNVRYQFLPDHLVFIHPISGAMGEGMGMGMGGNMGMSDPPTPPPNPPDPPAPPPSPPPSPPPPAREPHLVGVATGGRLGTMLVNGSQLEYIASDGFLYAETGASQGSPGGAVPGSIWIDGATGQIDYIDASGVHRRASVTNLGSIGPGTGAVVGSIFLNTNASPFAQVDWTVTGDLLFAWWNGF